MIAKRLWICGEMSGCLGLVLCVMSVIPLCAEDNGCHTRMCHLVSVTGYTIFGIGIAIICAGIVFYAMIVGKVIAKEWRDNPDVQQHRN